MRESQVENRFTRIALDLQEAISVGLAPSDATEQAEREARRVAPAEGKGVPVSTATTPYPKARAAQGRAPMAPEPVRWQRAHHALIASPSRDEILSRWGLTRAEAKAAELGLEDGALAIPFFAPGGQTLLGVKLRNLAATHEDKNRFCWAGHGKSPTLYTPPGALDGDEVWLAEGPLKALALSRIIGRPVAALASGAKVGIPTDGRALLDRKRVVYVGDPDAEGRLVPQLLARQLGGVVTGLRTTAFPPDGVADINDALVAAVKEGDQGLATLREQVLAGIEKAEDLTGAEADREESEDGPEEACEQRPTQADLLLQIAGRAILFHDEQEEGCAVFPVRGCLATARTGDRLFRRWLLHQFYNKTGRAPNAEAVTRALKTIEARAVFEGETVCLGLRVTTRDGAFYYDLADETWSAIQITPRGWRLVPSARLFRRGANTAPQVRPVAGGDVGAVLDFVSLKNEDDRMLFIIYLIGCLIPDIPHTIPVISGPQGATKSTHCRVIRRLVDPAVEELLSLPNDHNELALLLAKNYVSAFDNLDGLQPWQSDLLSRAATGGGITKRTLYTDEGETILRFRRCVVLNGINAAATRPDLLDRSLPFTLERVPPERRREEREFWQVFEAARPRIFGGMLDTLSKTMGIYPDVVLRGLPRMADWCRWGYAIAEALGLGGETFLSVYSRAIGQSNEAALQAHPVGAAVTFLMQCQSEWSGTPAELLGALDLVAVEHRIDTKARSWPKGAHILSRRLAEVGSNLQDAGIVVETGRGDSRVVTIRKVPERSVGSDGATGSRGKRDHSAVATPDATESGHASSDGGRNGGSDGPITSREKTVSSGSARSSDATDATFPPLSGDAVEV